MDTYERIEKIKEEQLKISNAMLDIYKSYGWVIYDNNSDIKLKASDGYTMRIDDGACPDIVDAVTHIYAPGGKIFEGRMNSPEESEIVMKVLGFEKDINSK
jgi:hypothetical protein